MLHCGVVIYDLMAPKWDHRKLTRSKSGKNSST